jgi:hypothetical protein
MEIAYGNGYVENKKIYKEFIDNLKQKTNICGNKLCFFIEIYAKIRYLKR